MKTKIYTHHKLLLVIAIIFLIISSTACSKSIEQPVATDVSDLSINHKDFSKPVSDQYNFIVYGHSYGAANDPDEYPSITLRENLDVLSGMEPEFMVSLGDMARKSTTHEFDILDTTLVSKFDVPVFNVVGNHDVNDRELYESRFGNKTFYTFQYANAVFIVLDTEIDDCYIVGEQLEMLQMSIEQALINDSIDTIFIMMHKVLFMDSSLMNENDSPMVRPNDLEIFSGNNFSELMDSLLIPAAEVKPIHIFAGDVGAFDGNLSPYYQKDNRADLYMYATGLGDSNNDVVLNVSNEGKRIVVTPYLFSTGEELKIENYDASYWKNYGKTKNRWEKYRPAMEFGKECALDVCRVGKNVFHLQCRYFILIIVIILGGSFVGLVAILRKKKIKDKR